MESMNDGSGSGYISGYSYGYGDGSGYGSGDGYGDGSGYGYWTKIASVAISTWPQALRTRFEDLRNSGAFLGFWKSSKDGKPSNGGQSYDAARHGLIQEVQGPLKICSANALHATLQPDKWSGERLWIVALLGDVQIQEDKAGALRREIIGEIELR